jgi:hypothetical protein
MSEVHLQTALSMPTSFRFGEVSSLTMPPQPGAAHRVYRHVPRQRVQHHLPPGQLQDPRRSGNLGELLQDSAG